MRLGVAALSAVLAACVAGVIVLRNDPAIFAPLRDTGAAPAAGAAASAGGNRAGGPGSAAPAGGQPHGASSGPSGPTSLPGAPVPTTSSAAPAQRGGPVVSAISPRQGRPGQRAVISGSGFLSPDGTIVAYFGSAPARTVCPSADRCTAVAPQAAGGSVPVRVHTQRGTSNAVTFTYLAH
jgi:hypothetical protein